MTRKLTFATAFFLLLSATAAFAHNGVEHILGTITALTETSVTVETPKHTSATVALTAATKFLKGEATVTRKDAKVGDRVSIDAKEGADKKLTGIAVKIGAAAAAAHSDHK